MQREQITFVGTSDLSGHFRGKSFPSAELPARLERGVGIAPSNLMLSAFGVIDESPFGTRGEVLLVPDPSTKVHVEFDGGAPESFLIGDFQTLEGAPWCHCPRGFLRRGLEALEQEAGLKLFSTFEQELVYTGVEASVGSAYTQGALRQQGIFGEALLSALRQAGVKPNSFLAEYAPRQYEVTTEPALGLAAADQAVITRELAQAVAHRLGHRAIFSPILNPNGVGNGTHIHFSFLDAQGEPAMHDPEKPFGLSTLASHFVAGLLHHLPAIAAITTPSVASYFRLRPNRWAPTWITLANLDRGGSLRICPVVGTDEKARARQFNIEFRVCDATASPYMALGALVHAGLDGIRKSLPLSLPVSHGDAKSEEEAYAAAGVQRLPSTLSEALDLLEKCEEARDWFGQEFLDLYLTFKRAEVRGLNDLEELEICKKYADVY